HRRRRSPTLHVDLIQVAVARRPEDDDALIAPSPVWSEAASLRRLGERPGPGEGNDRGSPARLHRFHLIACKEAYRVAVRAPEWIACAFSGRKRTRIDRGQ